MAKRSAAGDSVGDDLDIERDRIAYVPGGSAGLSRGDLDLESGRLEGLAPRGSATAAARWWTATAAARLEGLGLSVGLRQLLLEDGEAAASAAAAAAAATRR